MPSSGARLPTTGSWFGRVTTCSWPVVLSLASQAQPLPWMPASAAFTSFLSVSNEPKSFSMADYEREKKKGRRQSAYHIHYPFTGSLPYPPVEGAQFRGRVLTLRAPAGSPPPPLLPGARSTGM